MTDVAELGLFEERAENLSLESLRAWTAPVPHEAQVLRQLTSLGPKLLSGPRGCGKTTLLKQALFQLEDRGRVLPVFVNFGRSMFVEPVFSKRADADGFFQDWLVSKIVVGASEALEKLDIDVIEPNLLQASTEFVAAAEVDSERRSRSSLPGPVTLSRLLLEWSEEAGRDGVILLLDDAAHVFVPEQQRIFFEVLRGLRTTGVTYKAAIYPGVTEFSPNFHVGHDAKIVRAWVPVEGEQYLTFMRTAFERRIPEDLRDAIPSEIVDFFAVSSFGIPRAFFSLIEGYLDSKQSDTGRKARLPLQLVTDHADSLRVLHRSLSVKLPRYIDYVRSGEIALARAISQLKDLNETRSSRAGAESAIDLAVRHPIDAQLSTIFGLLEYGGLVRRTNETISLGDASYSKFAVNGSLLISAAALKYGQNPTLGDRVSALVRGSRAGTFKRLSSQNLLTPEEAESCQLRIGSCANCGEPRPSESAKFCSECGSELVDASRLYELLATSVNELPIPANKKAALREVGMTTIENIMRDRGLQEISKANRIGSVWAKKVYLEAEEFVGV